MGWTVASYKPSFLRLHSGLGHFFSLCFLWKAQTCYMVWWLPQFPQISSHLLTNRTSSPCIILLWCLLLGGPRWTHIVTGIWEMRIQLMKVLLASKSSNNIIHFTFKGKTWNMKQSLKNLLNSKIFFLVLEPSICIQNSLYPRNVLPFNFLPCDLCTAL